MVVSAGSPVGTTTALFALTLGGPRMALVRMLVQLSGTRDGAEWPAPGAILECPAEEAAQLAGSGLAAPFAGAPAPVESASVSPAVETATAPRSHSRKS